MQTWLHSAEPAQGFTSNFQMNSSDKGWLRKKKKKRHIKTKENKQNKNPGALLEKGKQNTSCIFCEVVCSQPLDDIRGNLSSLNVHSV